VTAVVPVHLYGQMAEMDAILALAERFHVVVIEDACQAHGAEYSRAHGRVGQRPDRSAGPRHSVSIRGKIWARAEKRAR
jgi:dTDP-4-amino-4,6-dideoxygalactose transaminase